MTQNSGPTSDVNFKPFSDWLPSFKSLRSQTETYELPKHNHPFFGSSGTGPRPTGALAESIYVLLSMFDINFRWLRFKNIAKHKFIYPSFRLTSKQNNWTHRNILFLFFKLMTPAIFRISSGSQHTFDNATCRLTHMAHAYQTNYIQKLQEVVIRSHTLIQNN